MCVAERIASHRAATSFLARFRNSFEARRSRALPAVSCDHRHHVMVKSSAFPLSPRRPLHRERARTGQLGKQGSPLPFLSSDTQPRRRTSLHSLGAGITVTTHSIARLPLPREKVISRLVALNSVVARTEAPAATSCSSLFFLSFNKHCLAEADVGRKIRALHVHGHRLLTLARFCRFLTLLQRYTCKRCAARALAAFVFELQVGHAREGRGSLHAPNMRALKLVCDATRVIYHKSLF